MKKYEYTIHDKKTQTHPSYIKKHKYIIYKYFIHAQPHKYIQTQMHHCDCVWINGFMYVRVRSTYVIMYLFMYGCMHVSTFVYIYVRFEVYNSQHDLQGGEDA